VSVRPPPEPDSAPLEVARYGRAVDVGLLLVIGWSLFLVLTFGYGRDQGIYAVVARTVLEGGMPYRDAWDFKPPGIYLVFAASRSLLGAEQWGIRLVEVVGLALTVRGLVVLAQRFWGEPRIGLLAGAVATLIHAQLDFWHTAQPESFGGMLTVWGLVVATGPARRPGRVGRWVVAGVLFGCAGLLKPPLAGAGAVFALWAAIGAWRGRPADTGWGSLLRAAAEPVGAVLAGGILPFAACLAWFGAEGALSDLYQTLFVFTPHYTALGWEGRDLLGLYYQALAQWLVSYSSAGAVGILLLIAGGKRLWRRPGLALLGGVIAIQLLGVALQGKFFPYHYGAVWPVTSLLVGLGWWHWWTRASRRGPLLAAGFALVFVVVTSMRTATKDLADSFWSRAAERGALFLRSPSGRDLDAVDALASVADVDAAGNRAVAEMLRRQVPPDAPVFVWGFEPVIYDLARRDFASRYVYNVPQRVDWAADGARQSLMKELRQRPPAAIVVGHHDLLPMVTGDYLDSAHVLEQFPALRTMIELEYRYVARVQDFDVYLARQEPLEQGVLDGAGVHEQL
jgi:hypothetical protein